MKFTLCYASDFCDTHHRNEEIEIQTLEDLKALQDRYNEQLIVDFHHKPDRFLPTSNPIIMIYDDYIE